MEKEMGNDTKYILVTGANRGVGRATVAAIVEERDDTHVFLGSRSVERGEQGRDAVLSEQPEAGGRIEVVQLDVTEDRSVKSAAEQVASTLDGAPLYGLVNNAGIMDGTWDIRTVLDVNLWGPRRVCDAFLPLMDGAQDGRVVNVSSASGPSFVSGCESELQARLTDPEATWEDIEAILDACLEAADKAGGFSESDISNGRAYGLSKALLNTYTMLLAREHPELTINACTPGFIETGMTRPMAKRRGSTPEEMGMKPPEEGTTAQMFLLFGEPAGSGWYFGSDAKRSPMHRYRSPGDPEYTGD
jgi:NAD(P)-dependent dehydrogenase (short-subunit alcohol dehydrogenase family)